MTDKTERMFERRMYAYCCAQAGGDPETCDCTNKTHDFALFEVKAIPAPSGDEVERVARAMAASDRLDWDEVCGFTTDIDECDSGSCMGAMCEDHDPDWSRGMYMRLAKAAIAALKGTPA